MADTGRLDWLRVVIAACISSLCSSCVVHCYDKKTGTDRLFGFGYIETRISPSCEGEQVTATRVKAVGFEVEAGKESSGIALGYNEQLRLVVSTNAAVRLDWHSRDIFGARVGTNFLSKKGASSPLSSPNPH